MEILEEASKHFKNINVTTNGLLIKEEFLPFLKEKDIQISVSLDGTKEIHEKIRGKGTFDALIKQVKKISGKGIRTNIQMTVSKLNLDCVDEVIEIAQKLKVYRLSFLRLRRIGRGQAFKELALSKEENKALAEKLYKKGKETKNMLLMYKDPLVNTCDPELVSTSRKLGGSAVCAGCRAGFETLFIDFDGTIYACPFLRKKLGNILTDDWQPIWLKSKLLNNLREKSNYKKCKNCGNWAICRGCRAEALSVNKSYLAEDPCCWR